MSSFRPGGRALTLRSCAPTSAVFIAALVLYTSSFAPTVSAGDSGELIVAAHHLGVPHPPGYPLWCLVGFVFSRLVEIGSVAWRTNLLSAILGAGAAAGVTLLLLRRRMRWWIAVTGGLLFAVSGTVWSQAIITEVYTLAALACVTFLILLDRCAMSPTPGRVATAAFVFGLGMASHPSTILLVPTGLVIGLGAFRRQPRSQIVRAVLAAQTMWVGLLVYALYLPLVAASDPVLARTNTATLRGWYEHVTRAQYGGYTWPGLTASAAVVRSYFELLGRELTWVGVLLLSIGITRRARDTTRWAGDLAGFVTAGPIYAVALAGLLRGEQLLDINIFYITAFIFAALLAARGLHRVAEAIDGRQAPAALRIALPSLALASLPALAASRWDTVEMRDNWVAHDYARALLSSMPRDADLYAQGDHELFPIMYVQKIDQYRNDVRVFDAATPDDTTDVYGKTRVSRPSRPVLTTIPLGRLDRTTVPWGLALLLVGDDHVPPSPRPPPPLERQPPKSAAALGRLERDLLARYHLFQARYSLEVDDIESALAEIGYGVDIARENPKCLNNFAALCARHGLSKQAKALWTRAIELDPGYELARTNLATLERTFSPPVASP
jgi:hypothetical protein